MRSFTNSCAEPKILSQEERRETLLERAKVTIAAGFTCLGGIILCVDSELTYSDCLRLGRSKFGIFDGLYSTVVMTGAGDWEYMQMA